MTAQGPIWRVRHAVPNGRYLRMATSRLDVKQTLSAAVGDVAVGRVAIDVIVSRIPASCLVPCHLNKSSETFLTFSVQVDSLLRFLRVSSPYRHLRQPLRVLLKTAITPLAARNKEFDCPSGGLVLKFFR
jgi:hypothetical protein